jgi:hypothetical protein
MGLPATPCGTIWSAIARTLAAHGAHRNDGAVARSAPLSDGGGGAPPSGSICASRRSGWRSDRGGERRARLARSPSTVRAASPGDDRTVERTVPSPPPRRRSGELASHAVRVAAERIAAERHASHRLRRSARGQRAVAAVARHRAPTRSRSPAKVSGSRELATGGGVGSFDRTARLRRFARP